MDITPFILSRYTTKIFDPTRKFDPDQIKRIESLLRFSPSSTNSQPWHFITTASPEGKAKINKATSGYYVFNEAKIRDAALVVIFCTCAAITEDHLLQVLNQEELDGRFANVEARQRQHNGRSYFVNMHRYEYR
ncbi:MAG: nitroreductase family protein, partial [Anaerolineae bacterium]|nr:nitroreductase family protein [Anaerolineae bacterium]